MSNDNSPSACAFPPTSSPYFTPLAGCGGVEYYWVDVATGRVLPFNGCIEGGGIQALPHLSTMPWA
ncbi:MAG TPA: hypothetical protein VIJ77_04465 [Candidatus Tumulicola sp.]